MGKPGPMAAVWLERKLKADICKPHGELKEEKCDWSRGHVENGTRWGWIGCSKNSRHSPIDQDKDYGFYSKYNEKPWRVLKSKVIWFDLSFSKITLAALCQRASGENKWNQREESECYWNNPSRKWLHFVLKWWEWRWREAELIKFFIGGRADRIR